VSGSTSTGRRAKTPFGECVIVFCLFFQFCLFFILSSLPVVDGEGPRNFVFDVVLGRRKEGILLY
jgi:hypothetical protein